MSKLISSSLAGLQCARHSSSALTRSSIMQAGITAAVADAERVVKKQKTCSTRSLDSISALLQEVQVAKKQLSKHGEPQSVSAEDMKIQGAFMQGDHTSLTLQVLQELQRRITAINTPVKLAEATKDLHSSIHKLSKVRLGPCAQAQLQDFVGRHSPDHSPTPPCNCCAQGN